MTTVERERHRIQRDLHDGAQQRLIALRIELGLAERLAERDPSACAALLRDLGGELEAALDELRALAHGIYPPVLADLGLVDALLDASRASRVPVTVDACEVDRYAPEVESAVYFFAREALQNIAKHATGASRVDLALDGSEPGILRVRIADDGAGFRLSDGWRGGVGIANMRDRVGGLGGDLEIRSWPGRGTVVEGWVPSTGERS